MLRSSEKKRARQGPKVLSVWGPWVLPILWLQALITSVSRKSHVKLLSAQLRKRPKQVPAFPSGQNTLADPAKRAINAIVKM